MNVHGGISYPDCGRKVVGFFARVIIRPECITQEQIKTKEKSLSPNSRKLKWRFFVKKIKKQIETIFNSDGLRSGLPTG